MKQLMMVFIAAGLLMSVSFAQDTTDSKDKTATTQEARKDGCNGMDCKNSRECCKNMKTRKGVKAVKTSQKSQSKKVQKMDTKQ